MTEEELLAMPLHSMRTIHKGCVNPITIVRVSGGWIYGCTFVPDKAAQERMVLIAQAELAKLQIRYQNGTEQNEYKEASTQNNSTAPANNE